MTRQQDGVGEEPGQLFEVGGTAVREVAVGLGRDADRDRGGLHQLGVGGLFPGQDHDRAGLAGGQQQVEAVLPGAEAAEEAYDDQVDSVEEAREVVEGKTGGVREPVRDGAVRRVRCAGAEQIGVGRRQQQDHAAAGLPRGFRAPGSEDSGSS